MKQSSIKNILGIHLETENEYSVNMMNISAYKCFFIIYYYEKQASSGGTQAKQTFAQKRACVISSIELFIFYEI